MTKYGITYQEQPTPKTCVQACLAMCLGIPVEEVIQKYGEASMNQQKLVAALSSEGIIFNQFSFGAMIYEGWYFAAVPSLNFAGGHHQILIHIERGEIVVFDPSRGKKYKEDGEDLISWADLTPFWPR